MMVLGIAWLMTIGLAGAEPSPTVPVPTFDEAAAKARYATFIIRWYEALDFDENDAADGKKPKLRWPDTKPLAAPATVARWPIGLRGIYANGVSNRARLSWVAAKQTQLPDEHLAEALEELFTLWDYCYEDSAEPAVCVPGACYFVPRCEYERNGYWLALRDAANGPELVGVLIWKEDRPAPTKDPQLGKWLAGIEKGLVAPPPK